MDKQCKKTSLRRLEIYLKPGDPLQLALQPKIASHRWKSPLITNGAAGACRGDSGTIDQYRSKNDGRAHTYEGRIEVIQEARVQFGDDVGGKGFWKDRKSSNR